MFLLAFGAGYAPWPLRNHLVLGEPVLTTTWGGPTLYDSLGPQATGASDMRFRDERMGWPESMLNVQIGPREWSAINITALPPSLRAELLGDAEKFHGGQATNPAATVVEYEAALEAAFGPEAKVRLRNLRVSEAGSDRLYRRAALDAALADPARVARLAVVKQGRFWRPWPVGAVPDGAAGWVVKAAFAAYFLPLMGLAVWGATRLWRGGGDVGRVWALALAWGPVLGLAGVCLVFVGSVRYRLPGEFPLAVAAGAGLLDLRDRRRARTAG